jgi:prevent-host-death family protein
MTNMPASVKHQNSSSNLTSVSVAEAKAKFSSIVKSVEKKQGSVTILRRGVPVAQLVPLPGAKKPLLRGSMAGKGRELGDIVSPYLEEWTVSPWPGPASDE